MKFAIESQSFAAALAPHARIAGGTLPVLEHTRIVATEGQLELTTTNLDETVTTSHRCEVDVSGAVMLKPGYLRQVVLGAGSERVVVEVGENHWAEVSAGGMNARVVGLHPDEMPRIPSVDGAEFGAVSAERLKLAISSVRASVGSDESRPLLCGALMASDDKGLNLVSTDGHRLSATVVGEAVGIDEVIVPDGALDYLLAELKLGEPVEVATMEHHAVFRQSHFELVARLIEGSFPDYRKVLPERGDYAASVAVKPFVEALRFVQLFANKNTRNVRIDFDGSDMVLYASDPQKGEGRKVIQIDYDGPDVKAGYNVEYMLDALNSCDADVIELEIIDTLSPTTLRVPGRDEDVWVVMPMRL